MEKTKKEEYEALSQIRGILKDFSPEDTYIGKAFEGCVEQAKENIDNDFLFGWKSRYLEEQTKNCRLSDKVEALTKTLNQKDDAIARLEDAKKEYEKEIDGLTLAKRDYEAQIEQLQNDYKALQISHEELKRARSHMVAQELVDLRQTVIELKAKLYDLMTAGEEGEEE